MSNLKAKINSENERIKRKYFSYLKEAKGLNEKTIKQIRKSIFRFEEFTQFKALSQIHPKPSFKFL